MINATDDGLSVEYFRSLKSKREAARAMLAALHQASVELEERMDCDDGRPNWAMRLKVEVDQAIAQAEAAGIKTDGNQ